MIVRSRYDTRETDHDAHAWEAWCDAWDRQRDEDASAGRRYDKARLGEAAHRARMAYYVEHNVSVPLVKP